MRRRRHVQGGFTLLELLVVITILGILSAVVVFAVRRSGDKGRAAAVGTEERTIRTALELYCAKFGAYPGDVQALIDARFLSNTPGYTVLSTGDDPVTYPDGKCQKSPQHYALTVELPNRVPGFQAVSRPEKGVAPDDYRNMVQLLDGRIFTGTSLYDPSDGTNGSWKLATPNQLELSLDAQPRGCGTELLCSFDTPSTMAVLAGATGACQQNEMAYCGKVLASFGDVSRGGAFEWELFDAKAPGGGCPTAQVGTGLCEPDRGPTSGPKDVGQWATVQSFLLPSGVENRQFPKAVQIRGTNCGANCGKVLMLNSPRMDLARLWDPKVWAASSKDPALPDAALGFEAPIQYGKGGDWDYYSDGSLKPLMEPLPSGDVLVVAGNKTPWNGVRDWYTGIPVDRLPTAQVFKAATGRFEPADQPPTASPLHSADSDETALLSDGRIMVTSNYANARAYSGYSDNTIEPASYVASPNASTNDPFYDATGNSDTPGYLVNNQPYPFPVPADLRKPDIYDPSTGTWASPSPVAPCGVAQQTPVDANGVTTDWWEKYCYVLSKLPNGRVLAWTGGGGGTVGTRSGNSYDGRVYALDQTGWIQQAQQLGPRSATPQVDFNPIVLPPTGGILITGTACGANCNKVLVLNEHLLNNYDRIHGLVAQLFTPPPSP